MFHFVTKKSLFDDYPNNYQEIILGAGCFWGVERVFWQLEGVWVTYACFQEVKGQILHMNKYAQVLLGMLKLSM